MTVSFLELSFYPFAQAAALQLQNVQQPLLIPAELDVSLEQLFLLQSSDGAAAQGANTCCGLHW